LANEEHGDIETARNQFKQAYALLEHAGTQWRADRISALTGLAKMANRAEDYAEAERIHTLVLQERQASDGDASPNVAMDLMNLGSDEYYQENFAQAVAYCQRARAMLERTLGPQHARLLYVDNVLGLAQIHIAGQTSEGLARLDAALQRARATVPNSSIRNTLASALGSAHFLAGDDNAAIAAFRETLPLLRAKHSPGIGASELVLGRAQLRANMPDATQTLTQARTDLAVNAGRFAGAAKQSALAQAAYGAALARDGNATEGEKQARAARADLLAGRYAHSVALADIDGYLADVLVARNQLDEARTLRKEALGIYQRAYGMGHPIEVAMRAQIAAMH
jgi:serine/threonine-protein kinase